METSLKPGFAQIFSCCQKNLSCPNFGGGLQPPSPPPPLARMPMNNDQHRFENTWPLSSCITFDWQHFAEVLRLFKLTLLLNASPTFRGDIIPFRHISTISYAGLTAKTLYRKKKHLWKWHKTINNLSFLYDDTCMRRVKRAKIELFPKGQSQCTFK